MKNWLQKIIQGFAVSGKIFFFFFFLLVRNLTLDKLQWVSRMNGCIYQVCSEGCCLSIQSSVWYFSFSSTLNDFFFHSGSGRWGVQGFRVRKRTDFFSVKMLTKNKNIWIYAWGHSGWGLTDVNYGMVFGFAVVIISCLWESHAEGQRLSGRSLIEEALTSHLPLFLDGER